MDAMTARRQRGMHGLGYDPYTPPPQPGTHGARAAVSQRIAEDEDGLRRVHLMSLAMQGELMKWDTLIAQDLSWNRLIYDLSPSLLGFALKGTLNVLPTFDNLQRWRKGSFKCKLCGTMAPTQAHVLSSCAVALAQKRYTYRHNQVLAVLYDAVRKAAAKVSAERVKSVTESPVRFHLAGKTPPRPRKSVSIPILETATDWQVICDLEEAGPYAFPLDSALTEKRPDIVMWSESSKQLVMVELTVPNETNVVDAHRRKMERYRELLVECNK